MISKVTFVNAMRNLYKLNCQIEIAEKALNQISEFNGLDMSPYTDIVLNVFKDAFQDPDYGTLDYCVYELDWLSDYKDGCVTDKDGNNIDLSTWAKVYDHLVDCMS